MREKKIIQHHFTVGGKGAMPSPYNTPYTLFHSSKTYFTHLVVDQTFCDDHANGSPEVLTKSLVIGIVEEVIGFADSR